MISAPTRMAMRPLSELRVNPLNPRGEVEPASVEELASSIRQSGILQQLLVTPDGTVVAGHRRLAAARLVGLVEVPVTERDMGPSEQLELMLIENIQREDLSPLQEARAYGRLMAGGLTQAQVARRIGVTGARVHSRMCILKLDQEVQEMFGRNELPIALALALARVADPHQQRRFASLAARRQMAAPKIADLIERAIGSLDALAARRPSLLGTQDSELPLGQRGQSATRIELLATLRREREVTISFEDLARAVEETCCWCGLHEIGKDEYVCRTCPVPKLVARVVAVA